MARRSVVTVLALFGAAALAQNACSASGGHTAPGVQVPVGGSGGSGGTSKLDASAWPDVMGTGGTGGTSGAGGSGTGGSGTGGSGTGGSCTAEICNNLDDDCNGLVDDNLSRPCSTSCGSGTQTCAGGIWGACSAMQPRTCMDYSTCKSGPQCVTTCPSAPAESCNLKDDDCNGQCDEGANCRVGVYRSYNGSTGEHFYTTSASEAACCGFTVEFANYYYLYKSATTGLVAFYRCLLANGKHFYTTSSNCEGSAGSKVEGTLGYIGQGTACGAVPLYRLSASNGDHFYTISSSERQSAISGGYHDEGVAGYVWKGP